MVAARTPGSVHRASGIDVPATLLVGADQVIERVVLRCMSRLVAHRDERDTPDRINFTSAFWVLRTRSNDAHRYSRA
jgi:hypothetical protein